MNRPVLTHRSRSLISLTVLVVVIGLGDAAAQDASLLRQPITSSARPPLQPENVSLIYALPEPPKTVQLHDTLTVVVNINTRVLSEGDVENRKTASFNTVLTDWLHFDGFSLKPDRQANGDQRIAGQLDSQFRAEADLESRDTLTFTIAAQVVDIRPNGNLVIEAHRKIQINEEVWELTLDGVVSRKDVDPNNSVTSDKIAELRIDKKEVGQVRDAYRRGWFQKFYNTYIMPF